jgi:phospholipid/cholesterol/gamma-HCH transport system substrate-binding protein
MRRIALILLACIAAATFLIVAPGAADDDSYEVRAIFDNASFLAPGMEVRVAGAKVGSVAELDVTFPDEPALADGSPEPGKAAVIMQIDDPGFQDWRQDASCTIHPQSLLGERFVECEPTQPRAPGTEPPPELEVIGEGEPGEGQRLLPLEQNGKAVDLDLVNNIMREPYPDRFRLILNDLGAGLAARGDELAEIIERGNPALRETNEVLAVLARQNRALEGLASDSDAILSALARERERVASFINEATTVGQATAARSAELQESFARFPGFLRELRSTMVELRAFSDQATPVFSDLGAAAPSLTRAALALEPFSEAGVPAFRSLGRAAEEAGPPLRASDPVIRQTRNLAQASAPATRELARLLTTMRKTGGFRGLMETIFGLGGTVNAFDEFGHFARALIPVNVCFDYRVREQAGCEARFNTATSTSALQALARAMLRPLDDGGRSSDAATGGAAPDPSAVFEALGELGAPTGPTEEPAPEEVAPPVEEAPEESQAEPGAAPADPSARTRSMRDLLDFLMGPEEKGGAS